MSKEINSAIDTTITNDPNVESITQEYTFWARLMHINDPIDSEVLIHYPSFTSTLSQRQRTNQQGLVLGENFIAITQNETSAWQSLTSTRHLMNAPPIVELID
jgi:hypothetical protein